MHFTFSLTLAVLISCVLSTPVKRSDSGRGTYFYQDGAAGSCGNVHSDSDFIVAVNSNQMSSSLCGKPVWISANGKTIEAKVADTCPSCDSGDLDLSVAAFQALSDLDAGVVPITWWM